MWEDYWTPYADDSGSWWGGGGGVDSWWDAPEFEYAFDDWGTGSDYRSDSTFDPVDPSQYGLRLPQFDFSTPAAGATRGLVQEQRSAPSLVSANADPAAQLANMPRHAYDDWRTGSDYRSDSTLDSVNPSQYGSQLPSQATSWESRLGAMADKIVGQLPKMALSALVGKPKLPGGSAMDMMMGNLQRQNAFNDRLASDYGANMPGIQQTAMQTLAQTTPQAQANEGYRGAMVSDAAGRRALERRMSAGSMSPEARMAAMSRYDIGAGANRAQAYNTGLGRGLGQTMGAATQAASLFPRPDYGMAGSLAASSAGMAANRGMQEFNMRQQQLSDISGLLDGYEEGRRRGQQRQDYA